MILDLISLVVGLGLLVYAADNFVLGSARLATLLDMSPVVIGAVVMGFGTSAPEMLVSAIAAGGGDRDLGVGNIVGSNVANLTLVLGTAAFVTRMTISRTTVRREIPLAIGASIVFAVFVVDGELARWEGAVLAAGLVAVVGFLVRQGLAEDVVDDDGDEPLELRQEVLRAAGGLVGTVIGAQLVVWGATGVADAWGVSGGFIGFSLVALGTSLPELVTCVACARRSETELIVGNLFGSNIFNSLAVGGAMGLVGPGDIGDDLLTGVGLALMLAIAFIALGLAAKGLFVDRRAGIVLLTLYVACMAVLGFGAEDDGDDESLDPVRIEVVTDSG